MDTLLVSIPDAAAQLAISRSKAYQLVAAGELPVLRIGRSARIRREDLEAWVQNKLETPSPRALLAQLGDRW